MDYVMKYIRTHAHTQKREREKENTN